MTTRAHSCDEKRVARPDANGYMRIWSNGARKKEHHVIVEKVLGRPLKNVEIVHHFNEIRHDNRNENLVVCPDQAYHQLLHLRTRALSECGNANFRRCAFCRQYDDMKNLRTGNDGAFHPKCMSDRRHKRYSAVNIKCLAMCGTRWCLNCGRFIKRRDQRCKK